MNELHEIDLIYKFVDLLKIVFLLYRLLFSFARL